MASRLELHSMLKNIAISNNVYFDPPESVRMSYPAIRYSIDDIDNTFANDNIYIQSNRYKVIIIDRDPDSELAKTVSKLPTCKFVTAYSKNNLNHFVFTLYY